MDVLELLRFVLGLQSLEADDGEILNEPLLDLLETKVIRVQLLARIAQESAIVQNHCGGGGAGSRRA